MSMLNTNIVDGIAIKGNNCLVLLLTDSLNWKKEFEHLSALQDKINAYIAFCESKQYAKYFQSDLIENCIFEIHFLHEPTKNALKFLSQVQRQLAPEGIIIECHVD